MNSVRNILLIIVIDFFISSSLLAQDYGITYIDESYQSQPYSKDSPDKCPSCPRLPVQLNSVTDSLSDNTAGRIASHQVGFLIPDYAFWPYGLLRGRQIVITLPSDFDVTSVTSVTYRDTDDDSDDPEIAWVYIYSESVVIRFNDALPGPDGNYFVYITLRSITNPIAAGRFQAVVKVDNIFGQTIAGPNFSEPSQVIPDEPSAVEMIPKEDLFLKAGDGVRFEGLVIDQYGNQIEGAQLSWGLYPELDQIGIMYGSFLQTTTSGIGRVRAEYGDLAANSGLITVTHGEAQAIFITSEPDSVTAGHGLNMDIEIEILDSYGNLVEDYQRAVWFSSDDPQAEIEYDEKNPYQFTPEDRGRKIFPGEQFVFKTAGQRTLTVSDEELTAARDNIYVFSAGLSHAEISYPKTIKAGEPFDLTISNAGDGYGNPFTGRIYVEGGGISPDGTTPIVPDIEVIEGSGSVQVWLFAANGINHLFLTSGDFSKEIGVDVLPADLAVITLDMEETQFVDHPFIGSSDLRVYDKYQNKKTDISTTETEFQLSVDMGAISPAVITADQFPSGEAALIIPEMVYNGDPGSVTISVLASNNESPVETSVAFYANGVYAEIDDRHQVATLIPQNWDVRASGDAWNPANLLPLEVDYRSGFLVNGELVPSETLELHCIPLPFNEKVCRLSVARTADIDPGEYEYITMLLATYEYEGDTIITVWSVSENVEVIPFTDFTIEPVQLPDVGFPADYMVPTSFVVNNQNSLDAAAHLGAQLFIFNDDYEFYLGNDYIDFNWEPQIGFDIDGRFSNKMPVGIYTYGLRISMDIRSESGRYLRYIQDISLEQTIEIAPRAEYAVDVESISPTSATGGADVSFSFDLNLIGSFPVTLDGENSKLSITDGSTTGSAGLEQDQYELVPGSNSLTSGPVFIPPSWKGKGLTAYLHLVGREADILNVDTEIEFAFPLTIEEVPGLQVLSLEVEAPNAPFINTGQRFALVAKIVNRSSRNINEQIYVRFTSDGQSIPPDQPIVVIIPNIIAYDTITLTPTVFADSMPNPIEQFSVEIERPSRVEVLPPIDDKAVIIIQEPASVDISPVVVDIPGTVPIIDFSERFKVKASFDNFHLLQVEGGSLALDYSGPGDFGVTFPIVKPFDSIIVWELTAPAVDVISNLVLGWKEAPIDLNTREPVKVSEEPILIPFIVRESVTRLVARAEASLETRPLQRGVSGKLFDLSMGNATNDNRSTLKLNSILIELTDRDNNKIDARSIVDNDGFDFYVNGQPAGQARFINDNLGYKFSEAIIYPGQELILEMRLTPKAGTPFDYFNMFLNGNLISAEIIEGPRVGQSVPVNSVGDQAFEVSLRKAIIAEDLGESFKNYPNPFDPTRTETEFRYFLETDSDVDIYIFTATGEEVRRLHLDAGGNGGIAGTNAQIYWDGRNGEGDLVLNGVYIALIEVASTGQKAKLKMAVVK
jgi:hypothetical protein